MDVAAINLKTSALISGSRVNGPGNRFVIWTQGCSKGCRGCFNPETWDSKKGFNSGVSSLARYVLSEVECGELDGLTLTGGDPLEQPHELLAFFEELESCDPGLKNLPRGVILFTGYTMSEIESLAGVDGDAVRRCVCHCDVVVDGRYVESLRIKDALAGSSNQGFHFSSAPGRGRVRVTEGELRTDQAVEVHVGEGNSIQVTGFPDNLRFKGRLRDLGLTLIPHTDPLSTGKFSSGK